uniref:Uncharacterized protein n=1 Tax=Avena sativa TaxID=4498 RepID=A0ACD5T7Z7_AVESA
MEGMARRSRTTRSTVCGGKPICKRRKPKSQFLNLPEDIQCKVLSELSLKEATRTSILSSEWGSVRSVHPKLRFDEATMCGGTAAASSEQYTQEFVQNVNAVLQRHNGMFVEDFEVKYEFSRELAVHLDSWVRFVVASQTKNLAFDLVPAEFRGRNDRYLLPIELLLDCTTTSHRLRSIQLSFVSIVLPPRFNGFPNLRKLDLHLVHVTAKDLQDMLSSCSKIEWLSIVRCHLDDELKAEQPLSCLLHLHIAYCEVTKIQFNAVNLKTFVYRGEWLPIDLSRSSELEDVHLYLDDFITLELALTTFPTALPTVKNLTLKADATLKMPGMLENPRKFRQLKYLHLDLMIIDQDDGNILSLASYLRAAPLIEKLELHFGSFAIPHYGQEPIRTLPGCRHNYLKNINVMGFMGSTGQLEFLLHAVENAPALEVLTLDPACTFNVDHQGRTYFTEIVREIGIKHLGERVLPTTKLCVL